MTDIRDWANEADLNGEASPAGWPEGMPPSDVNNSAREMMAALRRSYVRQPWYAPGGEIVRVGDNKITIKDDAKVNNYTQYYTVGQRVRVDGVEYSTTGFVSSILYEEPTSTIEFEFDAELPLPPTINEVYVGLNYQDVQGVAGPNLLGCIIGFTDDSSKLGAGLLHANGEKFSPSLYPDLAKLYLIGTESDGSPKYRYGREKVGEVWWPKRPDVRGYFPRFLDDRGLPADGEEDSRVDMGAPRTVGDFQGDTVKNVKGRFPSGDENTPVTEGGPFYRLDEDYGWSGVKSSKSRKGIGFDLSLAIPTSDETRPKNIAVVGVIVAYGGVVAGGLADVSEFVDSFTEMKESFYETKRVVEETAATVAELGDVMRYKGSVATYADLPTDENEVGDVYNVLDTGVNYAWTEGGIWDEFGSMSAEWGSISGDITQQADLQEALKGKANVADIPDVPTKTSELENDSGFITAEDIGGGGGGASSLEDIAIAGEGITFAKPPEQYKVVGSSVTVSEDFIATGFTGYSYISHSLDSVELSKGFVLETAFSVSSLTPNTIVLQLMNASNSSVFRINTNPAGRILVTLGSTTTSNYSFTTNTKTYVRVAYDGATMTLYYSLDGKEWQADKSVAIDPSSSGVAGKIATTVKIGVNATVASFDLKACALSYQGKEVWRAVETKTIVSATIPEDIGGAKALEDIAVAGEGITFTKPILANHIASSSIKGSPTISTEGILSNLSYGKYLQLNSNSISGYSASYYRTSGSTWEWTVKFKAPESLTRAYRILTIGGGPDNFNIWMSLSEAGSPEGSISCGINTTYSGWMGLEAPDYILNADTWYWVRLKGDLTKGLFDVAYSLEISTDGLHFTQIASKQGLRDLYNSNTTLYLSQVNDSYAALTYDLTGLKFKATGSNLAEINWTAYKYYSDKTEIKATLPEDIASLSMPDYSKGVSVSSPHTTTFPCYVTAEIQLNEWESLILYADDVLVSKGVNHDSGSRPEFISGFVDAGVVIRNNKNQNMTIYPLKGV